MGSSKKVSNVHVNLPISLMSDKARVDAMSVIGAQATTSQLYGSVAAVKTAIDTAVASGVDLGKCDGQVVSCRAALTAAEDALALSRAKNLLAVGAMRATVEAQHPTVADLATLGLTGSVGRPPPGPLEPPAGIAVFLGKKHGQFRTVAQVTGTARPKFLAQVSTDPVGPATWVNLAGSGKTHYVTGHPTGALVWVRYCIVRGTTTSDWCAPVPVTVP